MSLLQDFNALVKQYKTNKIHLIIDVESGDQIHEILLETRTDKNIFRKDPNASEAELDSLNDSLTLEDISRNLSDIKEMFSRLNDDQRDIVMHIYYQFKNKIKVINQNALGEVSEENPKIILQGPAGTGKSTIIDCIQKLITWEENKSSDSKEKLKVLKCAFTGKAATNIDGQTLHSTLFISRRKKKNAIPSSKKEPLDASVFFICDEISMVGVNLINSVNSSLQEVFGNDKLYGDRFVLLAGDLYQLNPVQDKTIYPDSQLWTCCEFYELTRIMRQQDEKFINALNHFRDSEMSIEDIELLKSREIQDLNEVPESVTHLLYLNDHVYDCNQKVLNKSTEKEEIVNVIDEVIDGIETTLRVKIGIRYMITKNIDVNDGLANGTTGVVKGFDYDNDGVLIIWMEFPSEDTGKNRRSNYFKKHSKPDFENWVPITKTYVLKVNRKNKKKQGFSNMFPLEAAEAITVHKCQGQTYPAGVCIHISNDPKDKLRYDKSLLYVALTRVIRLEDLYIMGNLNVSVKISDQFTKKTKELERLRTERKLKLAYETFEDKSGDVIIFLNTGLTFNEHYQFITSDKWYSNGSLLIFTETNTTGSDEIEIPNYEIAFRSDCETALTTSGGIICYKEANKSVEVIKSISDDKNKTCLTLLLYEKYLYIVTGVKGDLDDKDFYIAMSQFIFQYICDKECIFLIGNLNPSLTDQLHIMGFKEKISCGIEGNQENQCDVVFTRNLNIQPDNFGFYEYIPSSHKPIYVKLPPKSVMARLWSL